MGKGHLTCMLQRIGQQFKVIGATAGLADHLCAIIKGNYLPALLSDLVPATSCVIAMGLLGLDLTLPGFAHAQVRFSE
jgi:hypothetical protein